MRTNRLFLAVFAVCALAAGSAPLAQQKLSMEGFPAPGAPPVITVASTGTAPKKALRYAVAANQKNRMDMTMTMGMAMNVAGMSMPMDMPAMKMSADLAVTSVAPNGDITYDLAFTSMTVDGADGNPMAAALQGAAAAITSIKGSATVSNRGVTKSTKLDVADPAMKQMLGQMTSSIENLSHPLPEEAVGVGARWEVRQAVTAGGQTMFQKTDYEIVSIDGLAISMKVKTEQSAPPQTVSNPALPEGMEMTLEKMSGTGTGTVVLRLDSLVPTAEIQSSTSTAMVMNMAGQTQQITADVTLKMTIAPGKDK